DTTETLPAVPSAPSAQPGTPSTTAAPPAGTPATPVTGQKNGTANKKPPAALRPAAAERFAQRVRPGPRDRARAQRVEAPRQLDRLGDPHARRGDVRD